MADAQEQPKTQPEVELDLDDVKETEVKELLYLQKQITLVFQM